MVPYFAHSTKELENTKSKHAFKAVHFSMFTAREASGFVFSGRACPILKFKEWPLSAEIPTPETVIKPVCEKMFLSPLYILLRPET